MNQYKYLLKNIGFLTLSNFTTKLLSFFLVPLYTNILTTTDYGIYDMLNITVGIMIPIVTLNIQEGMLRFALDRNYDRGAIVTVGIRCLLMGSIITIISIIINGIFGINSVLKTYAIFFFFMFFSQALGGIIPFYVRGIGRIRDLSETSVIASAVTIGLNILFLVGFKWGLIGYFLANIIGSLVQCIWLAIRAHMFQDIHLLKKYPKEAKELLNYSRPLIANGIAWWANNAADRYVITFFCGIAEDGIYSAASKVPSILNIFQTIFNQTWALSVVKDYDPEDKSGFFANTYRVYNCLMTIACSAIIVGDKILAHFLYAKDFYSAWICVPWLTIAILFGAMSGYIGGFFTAIRNSKIQATSTVTGAVTNIILNFIFTPIVGILGAAIATTVCYAEVFIIRFIQLKKYIQLRINITRDIISYVLLIIQSLILLLVEQPILLYGILGGLFFIICLMYIKDIKLVLKNVLCR